MRFITIRDLRNNPAKIRHSLSEEKEIVLTSNGKPFAVIALTSEDSLEETLGMIRRIRAERAIASIQKHSLGIGSDRISLDEINAEIADIRKNRK